MKLFIAIPVTNFNTSIGSMERAFLEQGKGVLCCHQLIRGPCIDEMLSDSSH
jgi:hypothetical protein